jgi:hypothetical protein
MKKGIKLLVTILILIQSTDLFACSCADMFKSVEKKVENAYKESDLILTGKIIDKKVRQSTLYHRSDDLVTYTVEITKRIKGDLKSAKVSITSYRGSEYCGFIFEIGKEYLIYSYENNNEYFTDLCTETKTMDSASELELKTLKSIAEN